MAKPRQRRNPPPPPPAKPQSPQHAASVLLISILLVAAILRLVACNVSPPGLQVDEASNAWNAWCLLKTGYDEHGKTLPIFYTKAFGDYRPPLFLYLLVPFQAIGGLNVCTTRMPSAVGGTLSVALIYFAAKRLFDDPRSRPGDGASVPLSPPLPTVALTAAGLLAINPWHIQNSRWGHEANITPLLVVASVCLMLRARVPFADAPTLAVRNGTEAPSPGKPLTCFLAGLVTGICCYGYAAVRLYLPLFLIAATLLNLPAFLRLLRTRRGLIALTTAALGLALTFGPLLYVHLTDPLINYRGQTTWVWSPTDPFPVCAAKVLRRYLPHFSPGFLFLHGSRDASQAPPAGFGQLHWYDLPLLLAGAAVVAARFRSSRSARTLAAAVLLYPAGDLLNIQIYNEPNALRSFPGLPALVLLAAVGAVESARFLFDRNRRVAFATIGIYGAIIAATQAIYLTRFFTSFNTDAIRWRTRACDLQIACDYLRPRFDQFDAVVVTQEDFSFAYAQVLVFLDYDPVQWFNEPRFRAQSEGARFKHADLVYRFGKVYFMFEGAWVRSQLDELLADHQTHRVLYILRPDEALPGRSPTKLIADAEGHPCLLLYDMRLP